MMTMFGMGAYGYDYFTGISAKENDLERDDKYCSKCGTRCSEEKKRKEKTDPSLMAGHNFFNFGKYKNYTLQHVIITDPNYVLWCLEFVKGFNISCDMHIELERHARARNKQYLWF